MFGNLTRRHFLNRCSNGFGAVALGAMLHEATLADETNVDKNKLPADAALQQTHHPAKAKHVIFCYMSGGVSHVDSFDPKSTLEKYNGKPIPMNVERTQFNANGNVMASPFKFKPGGECGTPVSDMFPNLRDVADELAVIRSMTTPVNEHAQGNFFAHTGFPTMGYPSAGAWCAYGLGRENQNLPGFVVLQSGGAVPPHGGVSIYSGGYLPAQNQGSILKADKPQAISNISPLDTKTIQQRRLEFAKSFDQQFLTSTSSDAQIEAAIKNYETAFQMQASVPELCDISGETAATKKLYGLDSQDTQKAAYARQCLLARRLVERGVRFIELSCMTYNIGAGGAPNPWDQHGDLAKGHKRMAEQVDQPIAALIQDLKQRDLLDQTLIIWAGEFGRTPFSQGSNGRDHNPYGFSIWMAGGGIKGGTIYGATDEFGYHAIENKTTFYDLWATVLHQLGINHKKLTYRYSGRDMRLTDVHGKVLTDLLV